MIFLTTVTVTDAAGNNASIAEDITVKLEDPIAPIVIQRIVNTASPVLNGYARVNGGAGDTLRIEIGTALDPDANGSYVLGVDAELTHDNESSTWLLDLSESVPSLAEGDYTITATVENQSGTASHDASLVVDTTGPSGYPTVDVADPIESEDTHTPTITGTATLAVGDVLTVEVDGETYTAGDDNLVTGLLTEITIDDGGAGYTSAPTVTITGGGATSDATATATIDAGTGLLTGITIDDPGAGYTSAPTVTINPDGGATLDADSNGND